MAKFSWAIIFVCAVFSAHLVFAADTVTVTDGPDDSGLNKNKTTTEKPDTTTTPAITTQKPTTSTEKPTTSTEKPTTTSPTTTTSKPTPAPEQPEWPYNIGEWNYTDSSSNVTCIKLRGAFELYFPYDCNEPNHTVHVHNGTIAVPKSAEVLSGNCDKDKQSITLTWPAIKNKTTIGDNHNLTFYFVVPTKDNVSFALDHIEYKVNLQVFDNATEKSGTYDIKDLHQDEIHLGKSYKCFAQRTLKNNDAKDGAQQLKIASSQVEAFRNTTNHNFSPSEECSLDGVTDIVPIAVGATLAGLVVIVLIAYLIGRRRSRARGYQSV